MMRRPAFTLIEVLFAVVLLAVVVGVCMPYMRSGLHESPAAGMAEFTVLVDQQIEQFKLANTGNPTLEELGVMMGSIEGRCMPVGRPDDELLGQWVAITNGSHSVLRWARVESHDGVDGS